MTTDQERAEIRESLGWEWEAEPPHVPSVDEALTDTYAAVERIVANRLATQAEQIATEIEATDWGGGCSWAARTAQASAAAVARAHAEQAGGDRD